MRDPPPLPFQRRDLPPGLGAQLRAVRVARALTRRSVADQAGIGPRTLARIERGEQAPLFATLDRLCEVLQIDMSRVARRWSSDSVVAPSDPFSAPGLGLRALRIERGLTMGELAERIGVSISTLSRFERGLTASRLLTTRAGPDEIPFQDRDLLFEHAGIAAAFGFDGADAFRNACVDAGRRRLGQDEVIED